MNKRRIGILSFVLVFLILLSSAHAYNTTLCLVYGYVFNSTGGVINQSGLVVNVTLDRGARGSAVYPETTVAGGFYLHLFHNCSPGTDNYTVEAWSGAYYGNNSSTANFTLELNVSASTAQSIGKPVNYTATRNGSGVLLNWSTVSGATGYYIYYDTNATRLQRLNSSSSAGANVTLIGSANSSWNDTGAGSFNERYYRVAAYLGSVKNFTVNTTGKFNVLIFASGGVGHTMCALPMIQNISATSLPSVDVGGSVFTVNTGANMSWVYAYWDGGAWDTSQGLSKMIFGTGYYFKDISTGQNITINVGTLPNGTINQTIESTNGGIGHTMLGWESLQNTSVSSALGSASVGASIFTVNRGASDSWVYAYWDGGAWDTTQGLSQFRKGVGNYYKDFANAINQSYVRNTF